jgi:hypothetical protein
MAARTGFLKFKIAPNEIIRFYNSPKPKLASNIVYLHFAPPPMEHDLTYDRLFEM